MGKLKGLILLLLMSLGAVQAQEIIGRVEDSAGEPIYGVTVQYGSDYSLSDAQGKWSISHKGIAGKIHFRHFAFQDLEIILEPGKTEYLVHLKASQLNLDEVVVSGGRKAIPRHEAPLIINTISPKLFDNIAALSLAEGLSFSPGLRLENNCQNCGFTQVRINGLEGAYSQVLLNSRPIFSSLMGVYGLEMFPPTMIDRVEVLKGGGAAMFGGNAIGGTINIITKEAVNNEFYAQSQFDLIGGEAFQHSQSFGASLINEAANLGVNLFAFNRDREAWDANGDGFTEITQLQSQSTGFNAFYKGSQREKWSWDLFYIREFRRGGSDLELEPHQSRIAEQLKHNILGTGLSYEKLSADNSRQWSAYLSAQRTWRDSYYGGGGRIIPPGDSLSAEDLLALNAYGNSQDYSLVGGILLHQKIGRWNLSMGSEYQINKVEDVMPAYARNIQQQVQNWGTYLQAEYQFNDEWLLQFGSRLDATSINAQNQLAGLEYNDAGTYWNLSPRLSLKYQLNPKLKLRGSYARGFRAPQAFNEDLHIAVVGGSALFIQLAQNLEVETSNSYNLSADWNFKTGTAEANLVLGGFYTQLQNNFILSNQLELSNGSARILKRNGSGANVYGVNIEYSMAWGRWALESSLTFQASRFAEAEEIWSNGNPDSTVSSQEILRAPNTYGYLSANYQINEFWDLKLSANYTGPMLVGHIIEPETEYTALKRSAAFLDFSASVEVLAWRSPRNWDLKIHTGVRNLFNAYQNDFDRGSERDAGYIYGPINPRAYFLALKFDLD